MLDSSFGYGFDEPSVFPTLLQTVVHFHFHETLFFVAIVSGIGSFFVLESDGKLMLQSSFYIGSDSINDFWF